MVWESIETAPRDGRWVLIGYPENPKKQFRCRWNSGDYPWPRWNGKGMNWTEGEHGPTHWFRPEDPSTT